MMVIGGISSVLMLYASLSIGSLFSKRRILASFGAFIVLNMASNIIASFIQFPVMMMFNNSMELGVAGFHILISIIALTVLLLGIAYFVICNYILNRKLNLE